MAFWDDLSGFFSESSFLGPLLLGGAVVGSAVISSQANDRAAAVAADSRNRELAAIEAGNRAAQERFDQQQAQAAPAVSQLRTIAMTPPGTLTPEQQQGLEDARRSTLRSLNASGLRGSGRATTAVIKSVESDARNRAVATNQARSDAATQQLANQGFAAGTNAANVDSRTGTAVGAAERQAGTTAANLQTAQGAIQGQALADVASIIAGGQKARASRFRDISAASDDEEPRAL